MTDSGQQPERVAGSDRPFSCINDGLYLDGVLVARASDEGTAFYLAMAGNHAHHNLPINRDEITALTEPGRAGVGDASTSAARWRENGEPDPHGDRYNRDRARLCGGQMTDDEIANAVYLDPSIMNLTAAKERIRWLSRALAAAPTPPAPATPAPDLERMREALEQIRGMPTGEYGDHQHRAHEMKQIARAALSRELGK